LREKSEIVSQIKSLSRGRFQDNEVDQFLLKFNELSESMAILECLTQISTDEGDELEIGFFGSEKIVDLTLSRGKIYSYSYPISKIEDIRMEDLDSKITLKIFGEKKFDYNVVKPGSIEDLKKYEASLRSHAFGTKTEYQRIQTEHGQIVLRRYQETDISHHANYLFGSSKEFLESIGFDPVKLGSRVEWEAAIRKRLADSVSAMSLPNVIVAEFQGRAISMVFLDLRNADKVPRFHFHIFEPNLRGKGLGGLIFRAGARAFSQLYGFRYFLIEPRATNERMNNLMRKLGFRYVKNYLLPAGPVTQEMIVSQYEIQLEKF